MTLLTFQEEDRSIQQQPGKVPVVPDAALPRLTTTVPREYVHRSCLAEVFLTGCEKIDDAHYSLTGQWPRAHTFFTSTDGTHHDPMQAAETIRQVGLYLAHAELGVPLGHQFLMWNMTFTTHAEHLVIGASPSDLALTAICNDMKWKGKRLSEFSMEITIERDGVLCASGGGRFTCMAPATYKRLRGTAAGSRHTGRTRPAADPAVFGRILPFDVVLAPTDRPDRWLLDADPQHPILFDHSGDHIPGMVLLEAARQAACAVSRPCAMTPSSVTAEFLRYAEFDTPCWVEATALPARDGSDCGVLVVGRQDGHTVFTAQVSGPKSVPAGTSTASA